MGWPWSTLSSGGAEQSSSAGQPSSPSSIAASTAAPAQSSSSVGIPPPTRDEMAEAEFLALLKSLEDPSPPTPTQSSSPSSSSNASSEPLSSSAFPTSSVPIMAPLLFPSTISCRASFDAAFYCQSLGGQFNSIYRTGTLRNCSPLWSQFWFCIRTNQGWVGDKEREDKVRSYYEHREKRRYGHGMPSSEDVWTQRESTVVGAFEGDFESVEGAVGMLTGEEGSQVQVKARGGLDEL